MAEGMIRPYAWWRCAGWYAMGDIASGADELVKDGSTTMGLAMTVGGNGGGIRYGMVKLEGGNAA